MRLTLRTLLAYLDDSLEPAKAKEIGQKIAESEPARELIERIKQVTRRRRITTPPATGPGKLDSNTIAEYLDNAVSPEAAADVEAICLSSDVHLAEVASCHQILTMVLGEPMTVPPTAKQRMYGLVKGPEAIASRKPAPPSRPKEPEPASVGRELDDTLRLGLPAAGARKGVLPALLLFGGGFVVACLLLVAIWKLLDMGGAASIVDQPGKDMARGEDKDKTRDKEAAPNKDKEKEPTDKDRDGKDKDGKDKDGKEAPEKDAPDKDAPDKDVKDKDIKDKKEEKEAPRLAEIEVKEPDRVTVKEVGQFLPDADPKEIALCLQLDADGEWKRLGSRSGPVVTARPLMSLPGSWSQVYLSQGLRLTLCGILPEILGLQLPWFDAPFPLYESKVLLHHHDELDLDMTLLRGQILLTNMKDRPMQVRVRFQDNWRKPKEMHYEILLHEKGTRVMLAVSGLPSAGEPYFADPDDKRRLGPVTRAMCVVLAGFANVKMDENHGRGPFHLFFYDSVIGARPAVPLKDDLFVGPEFPVPEGAEEKAKAALLVPRKAMKDAVANLSKRSETGSFKLRLYEVLNTADPKKRIDPKNPDFLRIMLTRLSVRSLGALEEISSLLELLDPPRNDEARRSARDALIHWTTADRKNDGILFKQLTATYGNGPSNRILRLIHGFTRKEMEDPAFFESIGLIDALDDGNPIIRELSALRLYEAYPPGWGIPYSAWENPEFRQEAIRAWRTIIPPGKGVPPPKPK